MSIGPERPFQWWTALRKELQLDARGLSHSLGCLYRLIFPEDEEIYSNWHDAGFDVRMTIRLIEFYLTRVSRKPAKGKLEFYFPRIIEFLYPSVRI